MQRRLALVAAATAALAVPAGAQAAKGSPPKTAWEAQAALKTTTGEGAGRAFLQQRSGALTVALRVRGLEPGSHHAARIRTGPCAGGGGSTLDLPLLIANGRGVVRLWITLPTDAGRDWAEDGFSLSVHATADPASAAVACGDIREWAGKAIARVRGDGARGTVRLVQNGERIEAWLGLRGVAQSSQHAHVVRAGRCSALGDTVATFTDTTANRRGQARGYYLGSASTDVITSGYSYVIYANKSGGELGAVIGCGELRPVSRLWQRPWQPPRSGWWFRWWFV